MSSGRKPGDADRPTQPAPRGLPDDESIPVLTERLTLPSLELDTSLPRAAPAPAPAPAPEPPPPPAPAEEEPAASEAESSGPESSPTAAGQPEAGDAALDWSQIEARAREALLSELHPRLASELDRQLRERLQPTLVRMLLSTIAELRPSVEAAVSDAVGKAVAAEIARRRAGE